MFFRPSDFNSTAIYGIILEEWERMVFIQNMREKQWQHCAQNNAPKAFFMLSEMYARFIENMVIFQLLKISIRGPVLTRSQLADLTVDGREAARASSYPERGSISSFFEQKAVMKAAHAHHKGIRSGYCGKLP